MSEAIIDNRRIVKNTIMLYFRMIFLMLIGLYTSRVNLEALGVEDYGIYNVVGGFVALFSVISGSLTTAISRYITYEIGRGDKEKLRQIFSNSIIVQLGLSVLVVILAETLGLWFLYNKMVIPISRIDAAFWVFQFAVLTFVINLISTPYNACIVSHEKMDAFAYISIYEAVCKLIICFAVKYSSFDRLIFYSVLLCCVSLSVRAIYSRYCKKNFEECSGKFLFDWSLFKGMFCFAGWNFIGSAGWALRTEGGTILLNLFGGPIVNAANAIAASLSNVVSGFVNNFTMAFNPQITKSYAAKKYTELNILLIYGPKISFYMMYIIGLPVMLNAEFLLKIWLGVVPEHSAQFVRLILILSLVETVSVPLVTVKQATGNIRNYQLVVGGIQLLALPLAYLFLKLDTPVECLYVSYIFTAILCLIARLYMLKNDIIGWSSVCFLKKVILNVWFVALLSSVFPIIVHKIIMQGWMHLFLTTIVSVFSCIIIMYYVGMNKKERELINAKIKHLINRSL